MRFIILLLLIPGCGSVPVKLDPEVYYQRELEIEINDDEGEGYMVAKEAIHYEIKVKASGKNDLILIRTCNREYKAEDEGGKFKYKYTPIDGIETRAECPMEITSLDKKGKHACAFVAFEKQSSYGLTAYVKCNGEEGLTNGVSVCQSKMGLIQEIVFSEPVRFSPSEKCVIPNGVNGMRFRFKMPRRECQYLFRGEVSGKEHLHYTIGYEQSLIREN